jgi:hypothetical protein
VAWVIGAGVAFLSAQSNPRPMHSGGIINRASNKGLDVRDGSTADGAAIQQWDFAGSPNQVWDVVDRGRGRFSIINRGSGRALDVTERSTADGGAVQQYRFAGGDNQLWRLERVGSFFQIVNVASGRCLDVDAARINENGATVQQWSCSRQPNQQWGFRQ